MEKYKTHLMYDVIARICPRGMTDENCPLRKELAKWQTRYGLGGSALGFGYKVMENGVLLAPNWYACGDEIPADNFNLREIIENVCGQCEAECFKKERANPQEFQSKPEMQTVIFECWHTGVNCPTDNCPLRKELAKMEATNNIGYKELSDNVLLVPNNHYDKVNNVYYDIAKTKREICDECFVKNRQK
jgi:hypothetical protein